MATSSYNPLSATQLEYTPDTEMESIASGSEVSTLHYIERVRSNNSGHGVFDGELSKVSTRNSLNSEVADVVRYRVSLTLTPVEIEKIRESWRAMVNKNDSTSSALFTNQMYANLLAMDPTLEETFPSIKHQAVSFAGVLSMAVNNLDTLHVLTEYLNNLGKRHARILVIEPPHFELMGVAFIKTFHDRMGKAFTIELEDLWSRMYSFLANSILQFGLDPVMKLTDDYLVFPTPNTNEKSQTDRGAAFQHNAVYNSTVKPQSMLPARQAPTPVRPQTSNTSTRIPAIKTAPPATKVNTRASEKSVPASTKKGKKGDENCIVM